MKRLILKSIVLVIFTVLVSTVLWFFSGYWWLNTFFKNYYGPLTRPVIKVLSKKIENNASQQQIDHILKNFFTQPEISMSSVSREKKAENIKQGWFYVQYPIRDGKKITGWLNIWPSFDFVIKKAAHGKNIYFIAAYFFIWVLIVFLPSYIFFYLNFYKPFGKLKNFISSFEKGIDNPFDFGTEDAVWQEFANELNGLNEKIYDTRDTLQILFSVSHALTSHIEINEIFNIIIEIIRKKFQEVSCAILLQGQDGFLKIKTSHGLSPDFIHSIHLKSGEGIAGKAFQESKSFVVNDVMAENDFITKAAVEQEGIKSFIHIPLLTESKCIGLLCVTSGEINYFTENKIETLSTLAKYLSIGLGNARLYERIQELNRKLETEVASTTRELIQTNSRLIHKVREMKVLSEIAALTAAKVSLPEMLGMIVEKIKELLNAQSAGFFHFLPESKEIVPYSPFFGVNSRDFSKLHFNIDEVEVLKSVIQENRHYIINDPKDAAAAIPILSKIISLHSLLMVPLGIGKKNIGVLGVANKFGTPFDSDDQRILELIADRISGAIENISLYQELEQRIRHLTVLQDISSIISSEPVWEKILDKVVSAATQAFNADLCVLHLYDEKSGELVTQPGAFFANGDDAVIHRISVNDQNSLFAQVYRSGEIFLSPDASIDPRIENQSAMLFDVRSLILVPLHAENIVIGVLRIGKQKANFYTKDHLQLAELIAHQAAVIIENAYLYDHLRDATNELEHLNQIKNEFISMVSHELRTPLTTVKGFVKIVLQGETGKLNEQQEKFLQVADQSIDRLTILISDLLDISRMESGQFNLKFAAVDAKQLIESVIVNISPEAALKKITIDSQISENIPYITADRERIYQVFNNLIHNSIKFTPENGEIKVSAENKGDFVLFSVSDTGIGIPKEEHEKIFEKFYQVDSSSTRNSTGTGLGLAIVKSIVELHGGQIWVESEFGNGSVFRFIIPRAKTEIKDFRVQPDLTA